MWLPREIDLLMLVLMMTVAVLLRRRAPADAQPAVTRMGVLESCFVVLLLGLVVFVNSLGFGQF